MHENLGIVIGILLILGINLGLFVFLWFFAIILATGYPFNNVIRDYAFDLLSFAVKGIGLVQFTYVTPILFWLKRQQKRGLIKGVIIGAVITILLNGGCWIIINT